MVCRDQRFRNKGLGFRVGRVVGMRKRRLEDQVTLIMTMMVSSRRTTDDARGMMVMLLMMVAVWHDLTDLNCRS